MRRAAVLFAGFLAMAGCSDDDGWSSYDDNEIVFGITQKGTTTTAGYEYLSLAHRGGWSTDVMRAGTDGVCIHETLDRRIGKPNVGDGGRARFSGGLLPPAGLVVNANEDDVKLDAAAFGPGKELVFGVDEGFALPPFGPIPLLSPRTAITVTAPAASTDELPVDTTKDLGFAWTVVDTPNDAPSRVMTSIDTDKEEVRCFFDEDATSGAMPASFLALLGAAGTKGTLSVATHRQVTVIARGGWTIYVVAAISQREQPIILR